MNAIRKLLFVFAATTCLSILTVSFAQDGLSCPAIVGAALQTVDELCNATGHNQACYGSQTLTADPQPNVTDLKLDTPGDIADVSKIHALHLSAFDETAQEWGVSLLRLQANLPGQNVTMLLFGDVAITSAAPAAIEAIVSASNTINVRGGSSTSDPIVDVLTPGAAVRVNGRNEDGSWLRVTLEDGSIGWVSSQLVRAGTDFSILEIVAADTPVYGPMQAFSLSTGINDAPCTEAPESGILVQTAKSTANVKLEINGVKILLGSTLYVQAQAGDTMIINVVEGSAWVSAFDIEQAVPAGAQVIVPLDANLAASGPPGAPQPYTLQDVQSLPTGSLEQKVTVTSPLTLDELTQKIALLNQCGVVAEERIRVYEGPNESYPLAFHQRPGVVRQVSGKVTLAETLWWQLNEDAWVRSDVVETQGDCTNVSVVTELPPAPVITTVPATIGLWTCTPSSPFPMKAGTIYLQMGYSNPEWRSCEAARAGIQGLPTFVGNGPSPSDYRFFGDCHVNPDHDGYGVDAEAAVILEPGTYTYSGVWNDAGGPGNSANTPACTFTIVP